MGSTLRELVDEAGRGCVELKAILDVLAFGFSEDLDAETVPALAGMGLACLERIAELVGAVVFREGGPECVTEAEQETGPDKTAKREELKITEFVDSVTEARRGRKVA